MKSLSSVGLGLSLVFGCLFLALVAEIYYLLWWKKRIPNRYSTEDGYSRTGTAASESFHMLCWKKPSSLRSTTLKMNPQHFCSSHDPLVDEPQAQHHGNSNKDLWPLGQHSAEAELMRTHNFSGPPRFLFTIKEETREDLESEDAKSRGDRSRKGSRSKSLSDLFHIVETPYLTPIASPPYYTPPLTPVKSSHQHGFSSFFGSAGEAEFNWLRSSPPPMFQFLKDAEDKLWRRKLSVTEEIYQDFVHRNDVPSTSSILNDEENGSFITLVTNKKKQEELNNDQHDQSAFQFPSNTSQVLPLASSPPTLRLTSNNKSTTNQMLQQSQ